MVDTQKVALSTIQAVKTLGQYGRHFQSQDVRAHLKYGEQDEEAHYMHNVIGRLKKQGIIEIVGDTTRRRNQYLKIKDETRLRNRLEQRQGNGAKPAAAALTVSAKSTIPPGSEPPRGPRRVVYLEERVAQLEDVMGKFDPADIADIKARLDTLNQKVTDLVDMWS